MDRITKVDKLIKAIADMLPCIYDDVVTEEYKKTHFVTDPGGDEILSANMNEIEALANLFDQLYGEGTCNTGYYDPEEDKKELAPYCEADVYTGMYYVNVA